MVKKIFKCYENQSVEKFPNSEAALCRIIEVGSWDFLVDDTLLVDFGD